MKVVLQLGLGLLLLATHYVPATSVPSPQCQKQCGDVEIHYPFGIGVNCSLEELFSVKCQVQDGISKPIFGENFELLNISLANSTVRVLNQIATYCYNDTSGDMDSHYWGIKSKNTPYRFSDIHNKFTVIGCNTIGYIGDEGSYLSGCVSTCGNLSDLTDGSCSGIGCCQTAIPRGMDNYKVNFNMVTNASQILRFSRCSYAVLVEAEAFNFSTAYITTNKFNDTNAGQVPMVIDWAIRNETSCEKAKRNETGTYACLSGNSECVNSANGPGYVCNCSKGFQGNPYLPDGCQDVNECNDGPCPLGGVCHNTVGGYRCSCRAGRKFSKQNKTCDPDTGLIIGVTVSFLVLVIFSSSGYMILQKRKLNKVKQEYFHQHGGLLLFEKMKSEKGLAFTVFTEVELIHATNNYDKSRIIGKGGHGTVYKGIVKDNMPVAIKRCALIDERQKKEFGQEMLILSQINHKNIVKLVGCCLEVEVPMLVYEFIPNGTLYELIHGKNQALQISFSTLLRIVHEAAEGLNFLHSYASPPILHGDVKTANILLDHNYMAKVSDFGASILAPSDEEQYVTMVQGTCGYLDPEYMQTCQLTDKSDVYSFGVILLEVLTGQVPLKLDGPEKHRSLSSNFLLAMKENNLDAVLESNIKGQESAELIRGLAELAKQCLDMCGGNRPSMKEIADELSRLRKLSLHPWVQLETEVETQSLLGGTSTASFEIEAATTGYPAQEGDNMPMNPRSSYYAR
ncbi:putative wall-associated receptor kinase-like 16 [Phragmites australis]|uniref:putative wall-associated receptor kinase-like 16 n=1 Tax=Phragmites australis TaxID=29695 RepID=UPI002D7653B8|nr:putative wall-associated receptor kinase-like 16 [Phragmites australis]XP_062226173.1 putative wall-associated receptor kinase-like 16 [Phragmites australis]XP_062226175.1 putative wall-associated receptor kinase-like 16 [Phragmites australis]